MKKVQAEKIFINMIKENKENYYRLAFSYVKNKEDALDIVQDSIQKALLSLDKLNDEKVIKGWFYRIVINTSLDMLRKQKKAKIVNFETSENFLDGNSDVYQNIDLERSVEALPEKFRTVIILRYFEDLKIEEVAEILQENPSTVKTRLYKALSILRVKME